MSLVPGRIFDKIVRDASAGLRRCRSGEVGQEMVVRDAPAGEGGDVMRVGSRW